MAICIINEKRFEIDLVNSPMINRWMDLYGGIFISCRSPMDLSDRDAVWMILNRHQKLWNKFNLDQLIVSNPIELMNQSKLADIHEQVVQYQRKYKSITKILEGATKGDWTRLHECLHDFEKTLLDSRWVFDRANDAEHGHDLSRTADGWDWTPQFTPLEWHQSTSFSQHHLEIANTELGRTPLECFRMCSDRWSREGSLVGNLVPTIFVRARRYSNSIPINYAEWCSQNQLPVIGPRIPLADFKSNDFLSEIVKTNSIIKIELN